MKLPSLIAFLFAFYVVGQDFSQQGHQRETSLETATLSFSEPDVDDNETAVSMLAGSSNTQWLVQVQGPITDTWQEFINEYLQTRQTSLGSYYPHNTFLVKGAGDSSFRKFLRRAPGVVNVIRYRPSFKIGNRLSQLLNGTVPVNFTSLNLTIQLFIASNANVNNNVTISSVVEELQQYISTLTPAQQKAINITVVSNTSFDVTITRFPLSRLIVSWLSQHPEINWIGQKPQFRHFNYYANHVVQGDTFDTLPLMNAGLQGQNVILGFGDTGLDYDQCFFRDPNVNVVYNAFMPTHRKLAYYNTFQGLSNVGDQASGHGTHVMGTAAGAVYNPSMSVSAQALSKWNGVAPSARLAFFQIGRLSDSESVYPPSSLATMYSALMNAGQATISSNSWGDDTTTYTQESMDSDVFAYQNPNFLILFAAGNSGDQGYGSIGTPADAKNIISVGASVSAAGAFSTPQSIYTMIFSPSALTNQITLPSFGAQTIDVTQLQNLPVVVAQPSDACSAIQNSLVGAVFIVFRGTCFFTDKVYNAQVAGARFVIVVNSDNTNFAMGGTNSSVIIGSTLVPSSFWSTLVNQSGSSKVTVSFTSQPLDEWDVAYFSSLGPTTDGRIKPDILAPGYITTSVYSDGNLNSDTCNYPGDLTQKSGTSMATPVAAALSGIIQQYYTQGYYPSGTAGGTTRFTPTSALVKATLIASGVSLAGTSMNGNAVGAPPDFVQGYGRVQLDTALKLAGSNNVRKLWVMNSKPMSTGQRDSYCFRAFPSTSTASTGHNIPALKATLVWTDYWPSSLTQNVKLMNNLDLAVIKVSNQAFYFGNGLPNGQWDTLNNVEQVSLGNKVITRLAGDIVAVVVYGANVPIGPQNYALVVNGNLQKADDSLCANTAAFCPRNCQASLGHGTCNNQTGVCTCVAGQTGAGCNLAITQLTPSATTQSTGSKVFTANGTVEVYQYQYFNILTSQANIQQLTSGLTITLQSLVPLVTPAGINVFYSAISIPSIVHFQYALYSSLDASTTQWSYFIPKSNLPAAGGQLNFAVYSFCCETNSFTVSFSLT